MKTAASPESKRYCILRDSVRTGRNFSPARNVLSCTVPSSILRSLVRTKAPPLPGLTCWNSRIRKIVPSISMCEPLRNSLVLITAANPREAETATGGVNLCLARDEGNARTRRIDCCRDTAARGARARRGTAGPGRIRGPGRADLRSEHARQQTDPQERPGEGSQRQDEGGRRPVHPRRGSLRLDREQARRGATAARR